MAISRIAPAVLIAGLLLAVAWMAAPHGALAGVRVTTAEMRGDDLYVAGRGARPNRWITVAGARAGKANANGVFRVTVPDFSSLSCKPVVTDGRTSTRVAVDGCEQIPPTLEVITVPSTIAAGTSAQATVRLSHETTIDRTVTLTVDSDNAWVWDSVVVPAGELRATFEVTGVSADDQPIGLEARLDGQAVTAEFVVSPASA